MKNCDIFFISIDKIKLWVLQVSAAYVAKTKVIISCTVIVKLVCAFVFAYTKIRFSLFSL